MRPCRPITRIARTCTQHVATSHASRRSFATATTTTTTKSPDIYDVVVVGGGPAGLSLVNALRSSQTTANLKIALIESQDLSKSSGPRHASPSEYSNRCSSLTPASVRFLNEIGTWQHLDHTRIQPYDSMQVWDGITGSSITFDWPSAGDPPFTPSTTTTTALSSRTIAYMTENTNLTTALLARAKELGGITFHSNLRVEDIQLGEDTPSAADLRSWPVLTLSNGTMLAARLLVGADGANSPVRTFAGIPSRGWDYDRHGVVATLRLASGYNHSSSAFEQAVAYQRFLPTGPAALLPMPNGHASLVWSTLPANAAKLKSLKSEDFVAMVNAAFRLSAVDLRYMHTIDQGQLDEFEWRAQHTPFERALVPPMVSEVQAGSIASFPLKLRHADTYIGERVALLGDAAHTMHPLAGQGLNLGQADVSALHDTISAAITTGQDIGSTLALEGYNASRYAANNLMLGVTDKLHKVYSWESGPVVAARSLGLRAVGSLGWVKGLLMGGASGAGFGA